MPRFNAELNLVIEAHDIDSASEAAESVALRLHRLGMGYCDTGTRINGASVEAVAPAESIPVLFDGERDALSGFGFRP